MQLTLGTVNGKPFRIPMDAVTQALAFMGRRGSGKSYAAGLLAEQMYHAGAQFVAIDPVGIWFSLRLSANGKAQGLEHVVVFGGLHGDIPLQPTAGALVADVIVDRGISAVIDVSQFESDAEKARFSRDFADRFYRRKSKQPSPVHVFVEEAQEFIPQNPQKGEEQMLHTWQRMIRLGRNFGIGVTMISQRPQDVHKKALNQAECVFAFQLTGFHERKAVREWISDKGLDTSLVDLLPELKQGEPHVWSPVWLGISEVVKIGRRETFAAGGTPTADSKPVEMKPLAPEDIAKLSQSMAATLEQARANDPKELRKKIADLEKQVSTARPRVDQSAIDAAVARCEAHWRDVVKVHEQSFKQLQRFAIAAHAQLAEAIGLALPDAPVSKPARIMPNTPQAVRPLATVKRPAQTPSTGSAQLPKAERKILTVLAQRHPRSTEKRQLAVIAEYKHTGGGYNNALGSLRSKGYISGSDPIDITEDGLLALGEYDPLPTGFELIRHWQEQFPKAERSILDVLLERYPRSIEKRELAAQTGYEVSGGGFNNALGRLRTYELIEGSQEIKIKDAVFE